MAAAGWIAAVGTFILPRPVSAQRGPLPRTDGVQLPAPTQSDREEWQRSGAALSDEQVVASLHKGIRFLLAHSYGDNWESGARWRMDGEHGGETALVLYALLHAGQSLNDDPQYSASLSYRGKTLGPAVRWLCRLDPQETYVAALQACALALVPADPEDKSASSPQEALRRAYRFLLSAMGPSGGYSYRPASRSRSRQFPADRGTLWAGDLSNAQYGALGMWAAAEAGMLPPQQYWQTTDRFWRLQQAATGSWPYYASLNGPTPIDEMARDRDSMGVAGIATLFIAQEFLDHTLRLTNRQDDAMDLGLGWLSANFRADSRDLYYLYGAERVGLASGRRFFGSVDWYRAAAAQIIERQNEDGSWNGGFNGATPITATGYALLFLARGRNPVPFNKLQYEGAWNARPFDEAFLTRWMSKRYERPLNWQSVSLGVDPQEWTDAPVLLITGSEDPQFLPADIDKLRAYVEAGGMIFSTADGGSPRFSNAMRKYAGQLSRGKYQLAKLPAGHPLYSPDLGTRIGDHDLLLGMNNGVREIWIHSTADMGSAWQLKRETSKDYFEIPAAVYFYATGQSPVRSRLKTLEIPAPSQPPKETLALARLTYAGNGDPEPGAWPRLAKLLAAEGEAGIDLHVQAAGAAELDAAVFPVAHMTGSGRFTLKPAEIGALRKYMDAGGLLFADAAGGNKAFTDSFWEMARQLYPDDPAKVLPADHPIFTGVFEGRGKGSAIPEAQFRKFGAGAKPGGPPELQAISTQGRVRVLFSQVDVTSGLLGTQTWGIDGYAPETARALAENILRWVAARRK